MEILTTINNQDSNKWIDWTYLAIFLVILGISWIVNFLLLLAIHKVKRTKEPHFVIHATNIDCKPLPNYYSIISISVANILAVSFNPPISIAFRWLSFSNNAQWRTYCLVSISGSTVFCNLAFLHVLFSSLDTFLRLYSPRLYIFSQRPTTSLLKISAPWLVTGIQAGCQLSISNSDSLRSNLSYCLIDDINFLILRSVISFTVPLLACLALIALQITFLRRLAGISDENMRHLVSTYLYKDQLPEILPLVSKIPEKHLDKLNPSESKPYYHPSIPRDVTGETLVSLQSMFSDSSPMGNNPAIDYTMYPLETGVHKWQSQLTLGHHHSNHKRELWNFVYQREQLSVALNMATCIVAIGIWSPLILSTLTYRLCEQSSCFFQIPPDRIGDFQWWSYAGGAIYPFVYLCLDRHLRHACLPFCYY